MVHFNRAIESVVMCKRCLMDTTAPEIEFTAHGTCNFCDDFMERAKSSIDLAGAEREANLAAFVEMVKKQGAGKKYDAIIGLSGGVDSSWALIKALELGLRPLAIHMDNGWNDQLSQNNIANLVKRLGVDYHANVMPWKDYDQSVKAFLKADVVDVELLYDNAAFTTCYQAAARYGVKYILGGQNDATEGLRMSKYWNWNKFDKKNMLAISKIFGREEAKRLPLTGSLGFVYYEYIKGSKWISFLNYFTFNKTDVLKLLVAEYGYQPYPYKHYESVLTRFYQGYILPNKFNIDKRKGHLSALVLTGILDREEAIELLSEIPYASAIDLERDRSYFLDKLGMTSEELDDYIRRPRVEHDFYPSEVNIWRMMSGVKRWFGL
jgi:N-acetyl sugar amidotransferase